MMKQYNRHILFHDHKSGDLVWVKKKTYKPGESKKLAPRKMGPWCVLRKLPNGVNFEIQDVKSKLTKIVHHNRLSPASTNSSSRSPSSKTTQPKSSSSKVTDRRLSESDTSDSEPEEGQARREDSSASGESEIEDVPAAPRYPQRNRVPRVVEGAVPWSDVEL